MKRQIVNTARPGICTIAVATALAMLPAVSFARGLSNTAQMLRLSPETRLEQRCNARAMGIAGREHPNLRPDEFVAYAFADTRIEGNLVTAPGAALRSRGTWYHVSYRCRTGDDGLSVSSFVYTLGAAVPRNDWAAHYLVP